MLQVAYTKFRFIFVLRERKPDGRKRHPIFWLILQKCKDLFLLCTQIKENFLQFRLSSWLKGVVASTVRRGGGVSSDCSSAVQLSILPWQCSLFIIIIKNNQSNIWKKHTAPFKYVVKSVPLSTISVPPWNYAKHFIIMFVIRIGLFLNEIIKCDLVFFFLSLSLSL